MDERSPFPTSEWRTLGGFLLRVGSTLLVIGAMVAFWAILTRGEVGSNGGSDAVLFDPDRSRKSGFGSVESYVEILPPLVAKSASSNLVVVAESQPGDLDHPGLVLVRFESEPTLFVRSDDEGLVVATDVSFTRATALPEFRIGSNARADRLRRAIRAIRPIVNRPIGRLELRMNRSSTQIAMSFAPPTPGAHLWLTLDDHERVVNLMPGE